MKNALRRSPYRACNRGASFGHSRLGSPTADGANYKYTYQVTLSGDEGVHSGSFLNIVDFAGYVPGSVMAPGGFPAVVSVSSPGTGPGSIFTGFSDSAAIPDLVLTYNGPTMEPTGTDFVATFSVDSTFSTFGAGSYTAQATKLVLGNPVAQTDANQGPVLVPTGSVPEPATWALMLSGFGMAGGALRSRSRTKAAV